jgi:hypothetical protein
MRKVAACKIYFSSHDYLANQILAIENSRVVSIKELNQEEAMTEWMQGVIVLSNNRHIDTKQITAISDFYPLKIDKDKDVFAWHVPHIESETGYIVNTGITIIN